MADWFQQGFWQEHIHPEDREEALETCLACSKLGDDYEFEYRMLAADGGVRWIQDLVSVNMEDGEPRTLRGLMIDSGQTGLQGGWVRRGWIARGGLAPRL